MPFIIFADFEALNIPVEGCADNAGKSYTRHIAKPVPCSYCYVVVRSDGEAKTSTAGKTPWNTYGRASRLR